MSGRILTVDEARAIDQITARSVWDVLERYRLPYGLNARLVLILLALADLADRDVQAVTAAVVAGRVGIARGSAQQLLVEGAARGLLIRTVGTRRRAYFSLNPAVFVPAALSTQDGAS